MGAFFDFIPDQKSSGLSLLSLRSPDFGLHHPCWQLATVKLPVEVNSACPPVLRPEDSCAGTLSLFGRNHPPRSLPV